jgi:hypothetical protein
MGCKRIDFLATQESSTGVEMLVHRGNTGHIITSQRYFDNNVIDIVLTRSIR